MPKIIPDLDKRILAVAARHFESKGYEATDMKSLSAELGISVGTLYNYHPSKPQLFLAVSEEWRNALTARLLDQLSKAAGAETKLRTALLMLYENMVGYTGIWREFWRSGAKFGTGSPLGQFFKKDNEELNQSLQALFREVWKGHPNAQALVDDPQARLAKLMVGSIMQLVMAGGDQQSNRDFVEKWLDFLAPLPVSGEGNR